MCLFMCFMFRVSLVFMSVSSSVSVFVFLFIGVPYFSLSRVLGSLCECFHDC